MFMMIMLPSKILFKVCKIRIDLDLWLLEQFFRRVAILGTLRERSEQVWERRGLSGLGSMVMMMMMMFGQ